MTSLPCKKTSATRRNCTLPTIGTVPAGRYRRDGKTWIYSDRKETMNESDSALTMPLKSTVHTSANRHTGSTGSTIAQWIQGLADTCKRLNSDEAYRNEVAKRQCERRPGPLKKESPRHDHTQRQRTHEPNPKQSRQQHFGGRSGNSRAAAGPG